ncbi:MAG: hypothetical protein Q4C01_06740 [Clostridia bacterium]|nr:hypothetical protein [Clostridia bacterium]
MKETVECKLSQSRTCAMLNMGECSRCPLNNVKTDNSALKEDVELFETLLPEEGLYSLFETDECQLCKGENKEKKAGYAILDMGHSEPKRLQRKSRLFGSGKTGFLAPLQFAVCKKCRRRLLALDYIPLICTVITTAISLIFVVDDHQRMGLNGTALGFALPMVIVLAAILIGYIGGRIVRNQLKKSWSSKSCLDLTEHPFTQKMLEKGWFFLFNDKKAKPIFSRKLIERGLGTATKEVYSMLDNKEES